MPEDTVTLERGRPVADTVARNKIVADLEAGVPAELHEYYGLTVSGVVARAFELVKASGSR